MVGLLLLFFLTAVPGLVWTLLAPARPRLKGLIVGSLPAAALAGANTGTIGDPLAWLFLAALWVPAAAGGLAGAWAGAAIAARRTGRRKGG
jgi:hypothetical protein